MTETLQPTKSLVAPAAGVSAFRSAPRIERLTVMLTEACNLDCWMCDFRRSAKASKRLQLSPEDLATTLSHSVFARSLSFLTFTGGEPFAHPDILDYVQAIRRAHPNLALYFSSNCTLLPKMQRVFDMVENWRKTGLLVSIDGIARHDEQRGTDGSFEKTLKNLNALRDQYPQLSITLKFTITPVNCDEILVTWRRLTDLGYTLTVKMLEYNPFYTNRLGGDASAFTFSPEQTDSIRSQLREIVDQMPNGAASGRAAEIKEVLQSLAPDWRREARCAAPRRGGFLDCDLNLFTCKEFPPVINLAREGLDAIAASPQSQAIVTHEKCNTGACERCTSQMKFDTRIPAWLASLISFAR